MNATQKRKLKREQQARISKLLLDKLNVKIERPDISDSMIEWEKRDRNGFLNGVYSHI